MVRLYISNKTMTGEIFYIIWCVKNIELLVGIDVNKIR